MIFDNLCKYIVCASGVSGVHQCDVRLVLSWVGYYSGQDGCSETLEMLVVAQSREQHSGPLRKPDRVSECKDDVVLIQAFEVVHHFFDLFQFVFTAKGNMATNQRVLLWVEFSAYTFDNRSCILIFYEECQLGSRWVHLVDVSGKKRSHGTCDSAQHFLGQFGVHRQRNH